MIYITPLRSNSRLVEGRTIAASVLLDDTDPKIGTGFAKGEPILCPL